MISEATCLSAQCYLINTCIPYRRAALKMLQRNVRNWMTLRNWDWWKLFCTIKPLLSQSRADEELRAKEEELGELKEEVEKEETTMAEIQQKLTVVEQEKNELAAQLSSVSIQTGYHQLLCGLY